MTTSISDGCDERVAAAIEEIRAQWGPYTARSRKYSIFSLLEKTIDPAWKNYARTFSAKDARRVYGAKFVFSRCAKRGGADHVEDELRDLARRVALARSQATDSKRSRSKIRPVYPESMTDLSHANQRFHQTISSLRSLASDLYGGGKLPARIFSDEVQATSIKKNEETRPRDICRTCGELTEFAAKPADEEWPESDHDRTAKLSRRFCSMHRPKINGEWNSAYRRARRSQVLFDRQIFLLKRHTVNLGSFEVPQKQNIGSPFLWQLGQNQDLIPLENTRIRRLARELADCKITPRKASIIMLHERGFSQSEIARKLVVTRQAVSKFMATESFKQLTEIYQRRV